MPEPTLSDTEATAAAPSRAFAAIGEAAGGLGVIVLFVISGFLLYRPFAAARAPRCAVCSASAGEDRCDPTPSRIVVRIVAAARVGRT